MMRRLCIPLMYGLGIGPLMAQELTEEAVSRFANLALDCVQREYPNKISHVLQTDEDAQPPRSLTPAFYGCFDWHSAVHGHWLLARLLRTFPEAAFAQSARAALRENLQSEKIAGELAYLGGEGRASFERPYGLAWLLQLHAELSSWQDSEAQEWATNLAPLADEVRNRFAAWLPKLSHPIRTGEHSQTAFAMGLVLDYARVRGDKDLESLLLQRSRDYYLADRGCNLSFEPGGQDFLSPCLAEADLMRRVLTAPAFAAWLGAFLPELGQDGSRSWLEPAVVTDKSDGKLVHLDGLNLSRAWMLEGILFGLPAGDPRIESIDAVAREHRRAGLSEVSDANYEGGHWLGSFAVYLVTRRGLEPGRPPR
ncbi:MAG: DUF2891 domain-containing protein [Planctomycetota bacterium]|jgi:hypothetical protein